jgi:hypothetical protein
MWSDTLSQDLILSLSKDEVPAPTHPLSFLRKQEPIPPQR